MVDDIKWNMTMESSRGGSNCMKMPKIDQEKESKHGE